jgi:ABC-type sugar transport system substrate-binding protein
VEELSVPVEDITLGVSFPSLMSGTWQATEQSLLAYQEELGFQLVETVADNDVNKQLSQIEDMIAQGVDAIIVDPIDSKAILSAVDAANEAGIPIILFDRPPTDMEGVAAFVGSDNYAFGQEAARQLKAFADKDGVELKVLVLIGALTDENAVNRNDGFQEAAAELGIEIVSEVPTDWEPQKALDGVTNALQANPEINAIFIPSDYLLPSVLSALKTSDKLVPYGEEGHIMLAQIDGDGNGAKSLQDGYSIVDIAHDPVAWAEMPVDIAITLINGGEVEPVFNALPGVVGTVENIHELGDQFWGNMFVED